MPVFFYVLSSPRMMKTLEVEERDDENNDYAPLVEHEDVVLFWNNRQVCFAS